MQIPGSFTWLITGGAGFIGSHLARELVRQNQRVIIYDNLSAGALANLQEAAASVCAIQGDIRDLPTLRNACEGADYILHHAALSSVPQSVQNPRETMDINIEGTANVLEAAHHSGVKRVLFAGSSAIYGQKAHGPCAENAEQDCQSPYALSKQIGLKLCHNYSRMYGLETVGLIYFNVFGPGQNPLSAYAAVIARFLRRAAENKPLEIEWDGLQSRDFVSVHDVVQANLLAAFKGQSAQNYNVAQGKSYTLLELAQAVEQISGRKLERIFYPKRAGDVRFSAADISKIRALGFSPSVTLEEGLAEIWRTQYEKTI